MAELATTIGKRLGKSPAFPVLGDKSRAKGAF